MRRWSRSARPVFFAAFTALLAAACVGSATPRLPASVAAAIGRGNMQRLETTELVLYYPEARREDAMRFAGHVGACVAALRARAQGRSGLSTEKVVLIMPELPLNNAFVNARAFGYEELGVVPTLYTSDQFVLESGLPPDAAAIACHEATHFVHLAQIEGFSRGWNGLFGQAYTPQGGFDAWFTEGLAVYYETRLQPGIGRLAWPFWEGVFAAGVAGEHLGGGDLSAYDREYDGGNQYLVGSHFVQFLAEKYGEERLWRLIDVQARSVLFPFAINVRFGQVYGKSLSTLIDEFAADVRARTPVLPRPPEQREIHAAGWSARYGRARDGTEALITSDRDAPTRLQIFAPDGRRLFDRDLTDVVPPRRLLTSAPTVSGGISFTADGRSLYFVAVDQDPTFLASRLVRFDIASGALEVVARDIGGPGGQVSPDGRRYYFARAAGDHHDLAVVDLETRQVRVLDAQAHGAFVAQPRVSPDGTKLVMTTFDGRRFGLALHDATTGQFLRALDTGSLIVNDASFTDDERVVFLGSATSHSAFQIHVLDLRDGSDQQVSRAPYLAFAPQATATSIRFLNREGWRWTVDEIALPPRPAPPPQPPPPATKAAVEPPAPGDESAAPDAPAEEPAPAPVVPVVPQPAPVAPSPPVPPTPTILSDEAATSHEGLFVPKLRSPFFGWSVAGDVILGASLTGADRLERHRWVLTGQYEPEIRTPSFGFAYTNRQLAPVTLTASASEFTTRESTVSPFRTSYYQQRDRMGRLVATRSIYGNPISLGSLYDERAFPGFLFPELSPDGSIHPIAPIRRLGGVFAGATYVGSESTPYTGPRRSLLASGFFAAYPAPWGSIGMNVLEARARLAFTTPLPLSRRHTFAASLLGRSFDVGNNPRLPLMRVGGLPTSEVFQTTDAPRPPSEQVVDSGLPWAFVEPLRGYEDVPFSANTLAVAQASYRYPFIIDAGSASTLGILPSLFIRQLDLELFGVAAGSRAVGYANAHYHEAEGAALTLSFVFGPLPLSLTYQVAHRRTDDEGTSHLVLLTN